MSDEKKKGGLFKGLLDLVSEDTDEATTTQAGTPVPTPTATSATSRPLAPTPTVPRGNVDPATASALNETVLQQTPGVFTIFQQLVDGFKNLPEAQRFPTAIIALEATGKGTKAQLKAALTERVNALNKARSMFDSELEDEMRSSVGTKADQVARFDERIAQLEQDLTKVREDRNALQGEIDTSTAQLKVTKSKFEIAFQAVSQAIADENQQIAVYLN